MMDQLNENNTGHDDSSPATAVSPGRSLREVRERTGLSVADVAAQTRLAPRQIEALEADDFARLPEMPFVRGFVRNYAKLLHIDAQPLLDALPQTRPVPAQQLPASVEVPFPNPRSPQQQNLIWLGASLLLAVVVVAFSVWHYITPVERPAEAQVKAAAPQDTMLAAPVPVPFVPPLEAAASAIVETPVAAATPSAAALPAAPVKVTPPQETVPPKPPKETPPQVAVPPKPVKETPPQEAVPPKPPKTAAQPAATPQTATLRLVFDDESWTEVRDKDGNIISSQVNARGSELKLGGAAPFSLAIGRANSVHLYYRGKPVDLKSHINASSEVARLTLE